MMFFFQKYFNSCSQTTVDKRFVQSISRFLIGVFTLIEPSMENYPPSSGDVLMQQVLIVELFSFLFQIYFCSYLLKPRPPFKSNWVLRDCSTPFRRTGPLGTRLGGDWEQTRTQSLLLSALWFMTDYDRLPKLI